MINLIIGVLVLVLVLWAMKSFSGVNPRVAAAWLKGMGGVGALVIAVFLGLRGRIDMAIPIGTVGLGLLGWLPWSIPGLAQRTQKSTGQVSRVRSAFIEMELAHDSGAMSGQVLAGPYEGRALASIDVATLIRLAGEIDDESRALLMAYLDRREPGWRENVQGDAGARERGPAASGKMTEEEAYQILGLQAGAGADDITRSHRSLMKKLHPDQGGSTYLAARVNEAKDILLRRHRR